MFFKKVSSVAYTKILENLPIPAWKTDTTAKCNFFNRAWFEMTGRIMEYEAGDGWLHSMHPDDIDAYMKMFSEKFQKMELFQAEARLRHKDGTYHWLQISGFPFFDDSGKFQGFISCSVDVNEKKKALEQAAALASQVDSLRKDISDRDARITELMKPVARPAEKPMAKPAAKPAARKALKKQQKPAAVKAAKKKAKKRN